MRMWKSDAEWDEVILHQLPQPVPEIPNVPAPQPEIPEPVQPGPELPEPQPDPGIPPSPPGPEINPDSSPTIPPPERQDGRDNIAASDRNTASHTASEMR